MPPEALRLFVAIELPAHTRNALSEAMEALRRDLHGPFRWVNPDSLHLTLKFLGNVEGHRIDLLSTALDKATAGAGRFSLSLKGAGAFPRRGSPRVLWAGVGGDVDSLMVLQTTVEAAFAEVGEAPQENAFRPHLTLARVREPLSRQASAQVRERLMQIRFPEPARFDAARIRLIHSTLTPNGPLYRTLAEAELV